MQRKHKNIPIFIPHLGCPNLCVFCNQRSISGKQTFEKEKVRDEIEAALATLLPDCEAEIAYFGGSFTGIDRELMIYLLELAKSYIERPEDGRAKLIGIRMSTRPDYMTEEIMDILSRYPVKTVELGLQSMDDTVLRLSKRGHSAAQAALACRMVKDAGYTLIGQMMIGLPGGSLANELDTAEKICALGADGVRIYPTVTFYGTELACMAERGAYQMLSLEEAVTRSAAVLKLFRTHGVDCIRLGLCASDNLGDLSCVMGGANHPALGELVENALYYEEMAALLKKAAEKQSVAGMTAAFTLPRRTLSKAVGQRGSNREHLKKAFGLRQIIFEENDVSEIKLTLQEYKTEV